MTNSVYTVGLIVDPACGERLSTLAERMPVWVADTPSNRAAASAIWRRSGTGQTGLRAGDVTTFKVDPGGSPTEWAEQVLGDIDLHHGVDSHTPPYSVLVVIGTEATLTLRTALAQYGFTEIVSRPDGFLARMEPAT